MKAIITKEKKIVDTILGKEIKLPVLSQGRLHEKLKALGTMKNEKITVHNKITGKSTEIELVREGTTEHSLALTLIDKNKTQQQKDSMVAQYLFERGKDNGSFIAELFVYKGTHTKETHAFKKQIRFDFEMLARSYAQLMLDISSGLKSDLAKGLNYAVVLRNMADRMNSAGTHLVEDIEEETKKRMEEAGFGIYVDKNGRAYSARDNDINEIIKKTMTELEILNTELSGIKIRDIETFPFLQWLTKKLNGLTFNNSTIVELNGYIIHPPMSKKMDDGTKIRIIKKLLSLNIVIN